MKMMVEAAAVRSEASATDAETKCEGIGKAKENKENQHAERLSNVQTPAAKRPKTGSSKLELGSSLVSPSLKTEKSSQIVEPEAVSKASDATDSIAAQLMGPVLAAFRAKTGRDPNESEFEMLVETLSSDSGLMAQAATASEALEKKNTEKSAEMEDLGASEDDEVDTPSKTQV